MKIFINDHIIPEQQAQLPLHDRGLLLGDGLFETFKAVDGYLYHFNQHYLRLKKSADFLTIPLPYNEEQLRQHCQQLLTANQLDQSTAAIRITLTRGPSERGITVSKKAQPTLFITAQAYQLPDNDYPRVFITSIKRNPCSPLTALKTLNYLEPILARQQAQANGFDDGLMLNTDGLITECSTANIFFIKNNQIITPRLENGVFPGITRAAVIYLCQKNKLPLVEKNITINEALTAEAAFQTNSLIGVQLLSALNDTHFSTQSPLCQIILQDFFKNLS